MTRMPATVLVLLCCACGPDLKAPAGPVGVRAQRVAQLEEITRNCGVASSTLKLIGADELRVQPSPDEKFERLDCVLRELKKAQWPWNKMGFVGNEAYAPGTNE